MARHRSYSIEFKRQVVQELLGGEALYGLARRHDVSRNLIRVWVAKYEAGAFDDEFQAADLLQQYEAKIAALERLVGRQALEIEFSKGGSERRTVAQKRAYVRRCRPRGLSVTRGCVLMGLPRSTFYDAPSVAVEDIEIVSRLQAICDEFETYGYRRVGAALRQDGLVVNSKKVRRLMREHDLQTQTPQAFRRDDRQRPRPAGVPQSRPGRRARRSQPALERRHHLRRRSVRIRLCRADPRRLVAPRGRLCDRSGLSTRGSPWQRSRPRSRRDDRRPGVSATPTADRNTPRRAIASCSPSMGWWGR